ncbi:MAG: Flagellar P-ring protein [Gemmatimonadetes bacterium]|nr:Flagellar P-ring protein [Gemmatimonadota bacterium]
MRNRIALFAVMLFCMRADAQEARIRDLTVEDRAVPIRLMGYGLVVGLDNTGDRVSGGKQGGMTVTSVVNLLRRFDIEVPTEVMRMRNVAAVLVTAEVSPYLRPGGKFDVNVASVGDAKSLRGGVLWMTPLLSDVGGKPMGSAQGAVLTTSGSGGGTVRMSYTAENAARIPTGGLLEADLPKTQFASASRLLLREPDIGTASRIAAAINKDLGDNSAKVEDPGSIELTLKPDDKQDRAALFTRIRDLRVRADRPSRLVIDARDGTIVAGGDITVNEAIVSHGGFTLAVGAQPVADSTARPDSNAVAERQIPGNLSVAPGTQVSRVAAALHAMRAPAADIAAIFEALRSVGALSAEVVVR